MDNRFKDRTMYQVHRNKERKAADSHIQLKGDKYIILSILLASTPIKRDVITKINIFIFNSH